MTIILRRYLDSVFVFSDTPILCVILCPLAFRVRDQVIMPKTVFLRVPVRSGSKEAMGPANYETANFIGKVGSETRTITHECRAS